MAPFSLVVTATFKGLAVTITEEPNMNGAEVAILNGYKVVFTFSKSFL